MLILMQKIIVLKKEIKGVMKIKKNQKIKNLYIKHYLFQIKMNFLYMRKMKINYLMKIY